MDDVGRVALRGTDLSSRQSGAVYRRQVLALLEGQERVILDLSEVFSVSGSFADELFGVLAESLGENDFFSQIRLVNGRKSVLAAIARAVVTRLDGGSQIAA